ncbi:HD-GYP domain-containing protein [Moorella naiadis]|uniref:HD-GYP domain-containing protein n=1 Tax=Moorella naiadis (nom. illeg.) TaxID=3093670 RepID=UPI003D9C7CB5
MEWQEIKFWLGRLAAHSPFTYRHSLGVAALALNLAQTCGLETNNCQAIYEGALVHDVGKLTITSSILNKKTPLTPEEWQVIRNHARAGVKLLASTSTNRMVLELVAYHHERWDGRGYNGIKDVHIPLGARIIALADAFEAMTSSRPYQQPRPLTAALKEVEDNAGTQFDPELVPAFFTMILRLLKKNNRLASQRGFEN